MPKINYMYIYIYGDFILNNQFKERFYIDAKVFGSFCERMGSYWFLVLFCALNSWVVI